MYRGSLASVVKSAWVNKDALNFVNISSLAQRARAKNLSAKPLTWRSIWFCPQPVPLGSFSKSRTSAM
uniref:Uncharacterized protein n=1 Tax=uncultured marine virus TaxID=186617 RepID=A0A0F7L1X3_9VIRU|nr:hypothetical protein [uncultured marine virus]